MNNNIFWNRGELKTRAKGAFYKNYWSAVLVSLIIAIVSAASASGSGKSGVKEWFTSDSSVSTYDSVNGILHTVRSPFGLLLATVGISMLILIGLLGILFHILVGNVLEAGGRSFYIENLYGRPGVDKILSLFRSGNYGNVVVTLFLRDLYTFLWSLLFIIPGIIKAYEYRMVPYLLAEYPNMDRKEAFEKSRQMMSGQKWNTFVLDLSFIPWDILSSITFGIVGLFYVNPYKDATSAELYDLLSAGNVTGGTYKTGGFDI